jgi:predicted enzyme related to lactoylglutathione lyase
MGSSIRKLAAGKSSTSGKSAAGKNAKKAGRRDYVTWFEIPALDINRSTGFYSEIFDIKLDITRASEFVMALFPADKGIGGAIVAGPGCVPSSVGPLIYLNSGSELNAILSRIDGAGGRVVMAKTLISEEAGHFALFIDTEGNRLALHSRP